MERLWDRRVSLGRRHGQREQSTINTGTLVLDFYDPASKDARMDRKCDEDSESEQQPGKESEESEQRHGEAFEELPAKVIAVRGVGLDHGGPTSSDLWALMHCDVARNC